MMLNCAESVREPEQPLLEVRYEYTPVLPEILSHLSASLMVTTYQAGKLLTLGVQNQELQISFSEFDRPMGLAVDAQRLAIGAQHQIHYFAANRDVGPSVMNTGRHDVCYVSRSSKNTGRLHGHDLAWGTEGLWVVNTLFSCLSTLHRDFNFVPRWKPPFVSEIIDQDRCHLNGLAMERGRPRYVTALAESDTAAGWRPAKATSGIIMDVDSNELIARGLCMPHSPRLYQGQLWVLDSGRGRLCTVDRNDGSLTTVESFPGYTRGLSFCGQFAFVGLSRIRESSVFGGIPIAENRDDLKCGIGVVDLVSGRTVAVFQFLTGVTEIFAVEAIAGARSPFVAGSSDGTVEHDVWIVPPLGKLPPVDARLPWFAGGSIAAENSAVRPGMPLTVEEWLKLHPDDAAAWVTLGNLRQEQSRESEAIECYERAVEANPDSVPAKQNLGHLLYNQGFTEKAYEILNELPAKSPSPINRLLAASVLPVIYNSSDDVEVWRNLQHTSLRDMLHDGCVIDATSCLVPTPFFWPYQGRNDVEIMRLRGQIIRGDMDRVRKGDLDSDAGRKRRIRVGFLSAYFRNHTIGRLNIGRIERLNRDHFEITVILAFSGTDDFTRRFQAAADHFVVLPRDLKTAMQTLWDMQLDVLVFADVGMDSLTSTLAYSRFAPVQCTTWGHPETTGSPAIDYFLSSDLLETADADAHYTETLIRMPLPGTFYERPQLRDETVNFRQQLGIPQRPHLYVCLQSLFKFHPDFDPILAQILRRDPSALLVVLVGRVPEWTKRLEHRWRSAMPDVSGRLMFLSALSHSEFLRLLKTADVVLDPLHFGGGNSSYETLAMGSPPVTMPGEFLRSRITQALYQKMQLPQFIAHTSEEYIDFATQLGRDRDFREHVRSQIRDRNSVLFEDPDETTCFEGALRQLVTPGASESA